MVDRDLLLRTRWQSRSRRSLGSGFIDFYPTQRFPCGLLGFLLGSWVSTCFAFTDLSLQSSGTGSSGWVIGKLVARRLGLDWDGQDWDVSFKPRVRGDKAVQGLHPEKQIVRFQEGNKISYDNGTYQVPFYPDMVGAHLFISRSAGSISWNISSNSFTRCSEVIFSLVF
jgi:hypothetical protein